MGENGFRPTRMLYIVATPIGNMEDVTLRALRVLKEADFILCEDTRVTSKMLSRYEVKTPLRSYHAHSAPKVVDAIASLLIEGKNLALVTDAGTPGISDPGNELIAELQTRVPDLSVVPVPGASSLTAASSVAGFPMSSFLFMGFPPHKKGRSAFFKEAAESARPVIFYESPFRVEKTLNDLISSAGPDREAMVCRELTKRFETIARGKLGEVLCAIAKNPVKGEFVIVLGGAGK